MEETVISEGNLHSDDVPKFLSEYQMISKQLLRQNDIQSALDALRQSEELLQAVTSQGGAVDAKYVLCTLHNIAYCYQQYYLHRLGKPQECASYLDGSLYNSNLIQPESSGAQCSQKVKRLKYQCRANLHLSKMFSLMERKQTSLSYAQKALKHYKQLIETCSKACKEHKQRHQQFNNSKNLKKRMQSLRQYKLMESPHYLHYHQLVIKADPVFDFLLMNLQNKKFYKGNQITIKNLLGISESDTLQKFTIDKIMSVEWLDFQQVNSFQGMQRELTKESMVAKLCLGIVVLYYIAAQQYLVDSRQGQCAHFHKRSMELAKSLLPQNTQLAQHIQSSYTKKYGILQEISSYTLNRRARTPHILGSLRISSHRNQLQKNTRSFVPRRRKSSTNSKRKRRSHNLMKSLNYSMNYTQGRKIISSPNYRRLDEKLSSILDKKLEAADFTNERNQLI